MRSIDISPLITEEYIVCSAIWVGDGLFRPFLPTPCKTGNVICGFRHSDCYQIIAQLYGYVSGCGYPDAYNSMNKVQGFLTSKNRFVGREEAARIAFARGQISAWCEDMELMSEDLF